MGAVRIRVHSLAVTCIRIIYHDKESWGEGKGGIVISFKSVFATGGIFIYYQFRIKR